MIVRVAPLVALLAFVAELSLRPMAESDLFFRIKAGQEILARHGLPDRNLFSFTYPDHPDVDAAWLFEVGAATLHARGGFRAIVIAKTAVLLAAFAVAFLLCRRRGAGPAASALALAAALEHEGRAGVGRARRGGQQQRSDGKHDRGAAKPGRAKRGYAKQGRRSHGGKNSS